MPASFDGKLVLAISPAPEKKTATARVAVKLVEAAGQPFRPFRDGLDYAFILVPGCGACYPAGTTPDPSARPA